jgi:excisionase family DNA binding protein
VFELRVLPPRSRENLVHQSLSRADVLAQKQSVDLAFASEYLGVSIQSVRRRIAEGRLKAYRVGPRAIRVDLAELDALKQPIGGGAG